MDKVASVIDLIKRTSSYNDKQYLLKKNEGLEGLKDILKFIYNPYHKTGISAAKLAKGLAMTTDDTPMSYRDIIKYLKSHNTGSDADLLMAARFVNSTRASFPEAEELARAIVTQDLQIGVTAKTLNTVYGAKFIPTTGCMLGTKITDVPQHKIGWPCIVTEKLDGVRRILIKEDGVSRLFSRSGHEDTGLVEIMAEAKHLPDNRVYDGELLAAGSYKDSVALRQATNSIANLKGEKRGLTFNIFDMLPLEEFYNGASEDTAHVRKLLLSATLMDESIHHLGIENWPMYIASYGVHKDLQFIKHVPILGFAKSMADVEPIVASIWARGGEGVMLNAAESYYEVKRSKHLLKVKHTEEHTLRIVDMIEGTGKYEDMLGALIVDYKGNKVGVGSGFTDHYRQVIWANKDTFIGLEIEIDTFGESTNQYGGVSLNCPIFKRFVGDVE